MDLACCRPVPCCLKCWNIPRGLVIARRWGLLSAWSASDPDSFTPGSFSPYTTLPASELLPAQPQPWSGKERHHSSIICTEFLGVDCNSCSEVVVQWYWCPLMQVVDWYQLYPGLWCPHGDTERPGRIRASRRMCTGQHATRSIHWRGRPGTRRCVPCRGQMA